MPVSANSANGLWRFLFEHLPVRGAMVRIGAEWCDLLVHKSYPDAIRQLLGEAMAAGPLLASTLKFKGQLTLQAEGEGPVKLMLVQINQNLEMRGMARHDTVVEGNDLDLLGTGRLGLIIEPDNGQQYQALVPLVGKRLQDSLMHYFKQSEQLPTWMLLLARESGLAGIILQRMPLEGEETEEIQEGWHRLGLLADTVLPDELMTLPAHELLRRLFHQEPLRVFEPAPVHLCCRCNHGRISGMLLGLGRTELEDILKEQDKVQIECGFCGQKYTYLRPEVDRLFEASAELPQSDTRH